MLSGSFLLFAQDSPQPLPQLPHAGSGYYALGVLVLWSVREIGGILMNLANARHKHRQEERAEERDENKELFARAQVLNDVMGGQIPMPGQSGSQAGVGENRPQSMIGGQAGGIMAMNQPGAGNISP